jgi:hypothetical protein
MGSSLGSSTQWASGTIFCWRSTRAILRMKQSLRKLNCVLQNQTEFKEVKLRATRKPVFGKAFAHRKKVKFAMGGAIEDVSMINLESPYEAQGGGVVLMVKECQLM